MKKYIVNRLNRGSHGNLIPAIFIAQAEDDLDLEEALYELYCCEADLEYAEYEELDDFLQGGIMCGNTVTYDYLKEKFGKEESN